MGLTIYVEGEEYIFIILPEYSIIFRIFLFCYRENLLQKISGMKQ